MNKACKKLLHFGIDSTDGNHDTTQVAANVPIKLLRRYRGVSRIFDTISYHFNVYRIAQPLQHNLPSNCVVENGWARSSSTDLLYGYDASSHTLLPFEHLYMIA